VEKLEEKLQAKRDAIQELQDAWRSNSGKPTIFSSPGDNDGSWSYW
jgi:hypothetical protein